MSHGGTRELAVMPPYEAPNVKTVLLSAGFLKPTYPCSCQVSQVHTPLVSPALFYSWSSGTCGSGFILA